MAQPGLAMSQIPVAVTAVPHSLGYTLVVFGERNHPRRMITRVLVSEYAAACTWMANFSGTWSSCALWVCKLRACTQHFCSWFKLVRVRWKSKSCYLAHYLVCTTCLRYRAAFYLPYLNEYYDFASIFNTGHYKLKPSDLLHYTRRLQRFVRKRRAFSVDLPAQTLTLSADLPKTLSLSADLPSQTSTLSADLPSQTSTLSADLPQTLTLSADLPQTLTLSADLPQPLTLSADLPQPLTLSADLPQPLTLPADLPGQALTFPPSLEPNNTSVTVTRCAPLAGPRETSVVSYAQAVTHKDDTDRQSRCAKSTKTLRQEPSCQTSRRGPCKEHNLNSRCRTNIAKPTYKTSKTSTPWLASQKTTKPICQARKPNYARSKTQQSGVKTSTKSSNIEQLQEPTKSSNIEQLQAPTKSNNNDELQEPTKSNIIDQLQEPTKSNIIDQLQELTKSNNIDQLQEPTKSNNTDQLQEPTKSSNVDHFQEPTSKKPKNVGQHQEPKRLGVEAKRGKAKVARRKKAKKKQARAMHCDKSSKHLEKVVPRKAKLRVVCLAITMWQSLARACKARPEFPCETWSFKSCTDLLKVNATQEGDDSLLLPCWPFRVDQARHILLVIAQASMLTSISRSGNSFVFHLVSYLVGSTACHDPNDVGLVANKHGVLVPDVLALMGRFSRAICATTLVFGTKKTGVHVAFVWMEGKQHPLAVMVPKDLFTCAQVAQLTTQVKFVFASYVLASLESFDTASLINFANCTNDQDAHIDFAGMLYPTIAGQLPTKDTQGLFECIGLCRSNARRMVGHNHTNGMCISTSLASARRSLWNVPEPERSALEAYKQAMACLVATFVAVHAFATLSREYARQPEKGSVYPRLARQLSKLLEANIDVGFYSKKNATHFLASNAILIASASSARATFLGVGHLVSAILGSPSSPCFRKAVPMKATPQSMEAYRSSCLNAIAFVDQTYSLVRESVFRGCPCACFDLKHAKPTIPAIPQKHKSPEASLVAAQDGVHSSESKAKQEEASQKESLDATQDGVTGSESKAKQDEASQKESLDATQDGVHSSESKAKQDEASQKESLDATQDGVTGSESKAKQDEASQKESLDAAQDGVHSSGPKEDREQQEQQEEQEAQEKQEGASQDGSRKAFASHNATSRFAVSPTSGLHFHIIAGVWIAYAETPASSCSLETMDATIPETLQKSITTLRQLISGANAPFVLVLYASLAFVVDALRSHTTLGTLPDLVVSGDTTFAAVLRGALGCFDERDKDTVWTKIGSTLVECILFVATT